MFDQVVRFRKQGSIIGLKHYFADTVDFLSVGGASSLSCLLSRL